MKEKITHITTDIKKLCLDYLDKIKLLLTKLFVAIESDSSVVRKKHIRLGLVIFAVFLVICCVIIELGEKKQTAPQSNEQITPNVSAIEELAKGAENEQIWTELRGREVDEIKNRQIESDSRQDEFEKKVVTEKISKDEVNKLLLELKRELDDSYNQKLASELEKIRIETQPKINEAQLESRVVKPKKKIRKIGEYIPANSYAQAKLISGVDAGVGISSEANPRQTLLRITGEAVSAGIGEDYLKTNRLIGCLLSAKAVGDISSEKAYLDGVLLTCAVDKHTAVEVPVKAYITSHAKSGIRGEVVSREGDMVLKSFLSGLASGFGNGIQQMSQPGFSMNSSGFSSSAPKAQDIFRSGLGSGASNSGDALSQYFIKRAEQYQPVISVDEGIEVYVVFQEGFSLREEDHEDKK